MEPLQMLKVAKNTQKKTGFVLSAYEGIRKVRKHKVLSVLKKFNLGENLFFNNFHLLFT